MRHLVSACLVAVGIIHLLPVAGVLGAGPLERAYGVAVGSDGNLELLLRHRAVLFGLLGGFLVASGLTSRARGAAFFVAFASVASFLALALSIGEINEELTRVFWIDVVAIGLLLVGWLGYRIGRRRS